MSVETASGVQVGHVVGLQDFGAGDLVEIAPLRGESVLVPFTKVFVPVVDLTAGRIVVADEALDLADREAESVPGDAES